MLDRRRFLAALVAARSLTVTAPAEAAEPRSSGSAPPVRLAVLLIFDQLRGDYLSRWGELFGDGGFKRLIAEGAWFRNCHYPYAGTWTAAGHASLATGRPPREHGIIANEWFDRDSGKEIYCVASPRYRQVPAPAVPASRKSGDGIAPDRLLGGTLADALKEATAGKGRVVSLSLKDRSAVLPGGKRPDACYWFDTVQGAFVTSTFYGERVHPWVEDYNRSRPADTWFSRAWRRLRPELDYIEYSGTDDQRGEANGIAQGRVFPHPLDGGEKSAGPLSYAALYNSPFGNDLLLALAKKAIEAENLGKNAVPDLLCISFSSNDPVGHCWGPDSQEVLDCTLRTDRLVAELLAFLDAKVGRGRYGVVLSADHGVCPLPEVTTARGIPATRIQEAKLTPAAEAFLARTFTPDDASPPRFIDYFGNGEVYLDAALLRGRKLDPARVEDVLARWLREQPGIQATFTRTQLLKGPATDELSRRVWASFFPERSGDVVAVPRAYSLFMDRPTGTSHGSPHPYDTHVPLVALGPRVHHGERHDRVTPLAIAPILARMLGIAVPATMREPVPTGLFE
jgi:predicted AlkP superfamily pyrophosphatase or phosphodiesterase